MKVHYATPDATLHHGDCLEVLRQLPDNSVDAIVTDPPAGIGFMGKEWDGAKGGREQWSAWLAEVMAECLRVAKPGAHALVWALPRTSHWTACGLEDGGWVIRDRIAHLFGSGFPKSLNVSAAVERSRSDDKRSELLPGEALFCTWMREHSGLTRESVRRLLGSDRFLTGFVEIVNTGTVDRPRMARRAMVPTASAWDRVRGYLKTEPPEWIEALVKAPPAPQSLDNCTPGKMRGTFGGNEWEGWGTALKPSAEDWWLARKPMAGTVAQNVMQHGTGALNVDGCRVPGQAQAFGNGTRRTAGIMGGSEARGAWAPGSDGRWPPNTVFTHSPDCGERCAPHCPCVVLDQQSGERPAGGSLTGNEPSRPFQTAYGEMNGRRTWESRGDCGGASRFFPQFRPNPFIYTAKAASAERVRSADVAHPTVKPLDLMRWLVRLITPPGGVVLDPFAGSGTTGEAALMEGMRCVLVERESDYLPLIVQRLTRQRDPVAHAKAIGTEGDGLW